MDFPLNLNNYSFEYFKLKIKEKYIRLNCVNKLLRHFNTFFTVLDSFIKRYLNFKKISTVIHFEFAHEKTDYFLQSQFREDLRYKKLLFLFFVFIHIYSVNSILL